MTTRLDPDMVLQLCKACHGYDGVVKALAEKDFLNPTTKKPFTKHAIIYAAKKAPGWKEWNHTRQQERLDTAKEFKRIAQNMLRTKKAKLKKQAQG